MVFEVVEVLVVMVVLLSGISEKRIVKYRDRNINQLSHKGTK